VECAAGAARLARKRVRQTGRKLAQFARRLRSKASRRTLSKPIRRQLAAEARGIRDDTKALQHALACPSG
jgi:hypothetical protein